MVEAFDFDNIEPDDAAFLVVAGLLRQASLVEAGKSEDEERRLLTGCLVRAGVPAARVVNALGKASEALAADGEG